MRTEKTKFVENLIEQMSIEQKVGQTLVIGFVGTIVTPEIISRIQNYYPSGVRVGLNFRTKTAVHDPYAYNQKYIHRALRHPVRTVKDCIPNFPAPQCTNEEYCEFLDILKQAALTNGLKVPVHITLDMEGDLSCDYPRGGIFNFPLPMGLSATGNPQNAYDVAWAVATQVVPIGFNWIHSPVLDVNTEPLNPEISTRSYGENAEKVIEYAIEALKGFKEGGLVTTGKHFPGRGSSRSDAHLGLPIIDLDREQMRQHLDPFQALINAGLPSIMTAHTIYPAFDPDEPATLSKKIISGLLKDEMGFKGVVTTDDITMGGIVERYEVFDACIKAVNAGADLLLVRDEGPIIDEVFEGMVKAAQKGQIAEERLNDAVRRTLSVKYDYGIFNDGNIKPVDKASEGIKNPKIKIIAQQVASQALKVIRDENNILPLDPNKKVLLVEQRNSLHSDTNSQKCHPGILWEYMLKHSEKVYMVETAMDFTDYDKERVRRRLKEVDVIVTTNYFSRRAKHGNDFVQELHQTGKPVIVVTNSHYSFTVSPAYKTVIVTYSVAPESLEAAAKTIYGASVK